MLVLAVFMGRGGKLHWELCCIYACMYVWMDGCNVMYVYMYGWMDGCNVCMYACMPVLVHLAIEKFPFLISTF